ncbi:MAG: hypothetical protein JW863_21790 [Chitinispirillaceae bacterium]|nr:hypothetical protein [Chitinispirillaceae bacterium]
MVQNETVISSQQEMPSDEISLIDLVLILWKGKFIILSFTILATIGGFIYAIRAPELFSTSTIFITKNGSKGNGNLGQLAALAGVNLSSGGDIDPSKYLGQVIQDKEFLAKLFDRKWFFKGDSILLDSILKIQPDTTLSHWKYAHFISKINTIRNSKIIILKTDAKTGLQTLSCNAPDPQLSYDLNDFTLDYLSSYMRNSLKSQAKEKRIFIENRIKETQNVLKSSEDTLAKFKARNFNTRSPYTILEEARLTRDADMNQQIYIQLKQQYELAKIQELDNQTLLQVVKSAEVPVLRSKPNKRLIVIVSFMVGVCIGVFTTLIVNAVLKIKHSSTEAGSLGNIRTEPLSGINVS